MSSLSALILGFAGASAISQLHGDLTPEKGATWTHTKGGARFGMLIGPNLDRYTRPDRTRVADLVAAIKRDRRHLDQHDVIEALDQRSYAYAVSCGRYRRLCSRPLPIESMVRQFAFATKAKASDPEVTPIDPGVTPVCALDLVVCLHDAHCHRGREHLSDLDLHWYAELRRRSLEACDLYWRHYLPATPKPVADELELRRGAETAIVGLLCHALAEGYASMAMDVWTAESLLEISPATWWRAIGRLEDDGIIATIPTYRNATELERAEGMPAVVRATNCYVAGPRLHAWADAIRNPKAMRQHMAALDRSRRLARRARRHARRKEVVDTPADLTPEVIADARTSGEAKRGSLEREAAALRDAKRVAERAAELVQAGDVVQGLAVIEAARAATDVQIDREPAKLTPVESVALELDAIDADPAELGRATMVYLTASAYGAERIAKNAIRDAKVAKSPDLPCVSFCDTPPSGELKNPRRGLRMSRASATDLHPRPGPGGPKTPTNSSPTPQPRTADPTPPGPAVVTSTDDPPHRESISPCPEGACADSPPRREAPERPASWRDLIPDLLAGARARANRGGDLELDHAALNPHIPAGDGQRQRDEASENNHRRDLTAADFVEFEHANTFPGGETSPPHVESPTFHHDASGFFFTRDPGRDVGKLPT